MRPWISKARFCWMIGFEFTLHCLKIMPFQRGDFTASPAVDFQGQYSKFQTQFVP